MSVLKAGVVGCGNISDIYFQLNNRFDDIQIIACTDLNMAQATQKAANYKEIEALSMDDFFQDERIELVINLTIPSAHYAVHKRALEAGKHAYGEKPLALSLTEAEELRKLAKEKKSLFRSCPRYFFRWWPSNGKETNRRWLDWQTSIG